MSDQGAVSQRQQRLAELKAKHGDYVAKINTQCPADLEWFDARDLAELDKHYAHIDVFQQRTFLNTLQSQILGSTDLAALNEWTASA